MKTFDEFIDGYKRILDYMNQEIARFVEQEPNDTKEYMQARAKAKALVAKRELLVTILHEAKEVVIPRVEVKPSMLEVVNPFAKHPAFASGNPFDPKIKEVDFQKPKIIKSSKGKYREIKLHDVVDALIINTIKKGCILFSAVDISKFLGTSLYKVSGHVYKLRKSKLIEFKKIALSEDLLTTSETANKYCGYRFTEIGLQKYADRIDFYKEREVK